MLMVSRFDVQIHVWELKKKARFILRASRFLLKWAWPGPVVSPLIGAHCGQPWFTTSRRLQRTRCCSAVLGWPSVFLNFDLSPGTLNPVQKLLLPPLAIQDASELPSHLSVSLKSRVRRTSHAVECLLILNPFSRAILSRACSGSLSCHLDPALGKC